jgi:hypothetical protein
MIGVLARGGFFQDQGEGNLEEGHVGENIISVSS